MKSVIFVDDEPNVLQGLKRMLRSMRKEWKMTFAGSGQEALAQFETEHFDVIVSDMRMPNMDGAQLLTEVARHYPNTVRIVLSGQSDKEHIFRAVGKTHQYLSKPCDAETLKQTVARACALRDLMSDAALESLASQMDQMPSMPEIYLELMDELKEEAPSIKLISRLISSDMAMTAKILQMVNSAFFGIRRKVTTVELAVSYLGLENISSLAMAANLFSQFEKTNKIPGFSMDGLWGHSGQVGRYAQTICKLVNSSKQETDNAMTAGLLHDCGKLVLAANLTDKYADVLKLSKDERIPLTEAEHQIIGTNHAMLGAYILGVWGLPDDIVEAVAYHHKPSDSHTDKFSALTAVYAANYLARILTNQNPSDKLDLEYAARLEIERDIEIWKARLR